MSPAASVRWGFLGAGFVASRGVGPAVHAAGNAVLELAAARDLARAEGLGARRSSTSYADVCHDDDVDAVYVSLANDDHLRWVVAALEAGKAVLCEKPLGLDVQQVQRMSEAARASGALLVEASWNRWHPRTRRVEQLLADLDARDELDVRAWFTFPGVPADNYRLDPARGGGALLDVGCYAIAAAQAVLGDETTVAYAEQRTGDTGVDLTTTAVLSSPRGTARITASFEQAESQGWVVTAPDLVLDVVDPAFTSWRTGSTLRVVHDGAERVEEFEPCDAYQLMVEAVSARVRGEDAWVLPLSVSHAVASTIEEIREMLARP